MAVRDIGVFLVAGDLGGPVEQRHVQQAVDDIAIVVLRAQGAPRLDELALLVEAADKLVGGQDGGVAPLFAAHQLPGGHAGRAVQEAHVVVVHLDVVADAVVEAVHQRERGVLEAVLAGALPGQPHLARPEAAGPLVVLAGGIDVVHAGVILAVAGEQRQVLPHDLHRRVQRRACFGRGDGGIGEGFHRKSLLIYNMEPEIPAGMQKMQGTGKYARTLQGRISPSNRKRQRPARSISATQGIQSAPGSARQRWLP